MLLYQEMFELSVTDHKLKNVIVREIKKNFQELFIT